MITLCLNFWLFFSSWLYLVTLLHFYAPRTITREIHSTQLTVDPAAIRLWITFAFHAQPHLRIEGRRYFCCATRTA